MKDFAKRVNKMLGKGQCKKLSKYVCVDAYFHLLYSPLKYSILIGELQL